MDTSYNDIPYMGRVHSQTHIERMALTAHIFQVDTVALENSRVLELGCGDGSNLINMAINLPNATFVGIDGSSVHIERANAMATFANAENIKFEAINILDIHDQFGDFDYIICHGVFSWVPEEVRQHILKIYRERLTVNGIGYISYNSYPAWKQHEMLREMMRYHAFRMDNSTDQIAQARALVQFLGQHVLSGDTTPYGNFIQSQVEFISGLTDEYLFHEYLEAENQPYWFQEFIQLLDGNGLQYLGDTDLSSMMNVHWPEETKDLLNHISPSQYELEQYMDMLRCRRFRCSLFVHHEQTVNRNIEPHSFQSLYFSYKAHDKWTTEAVTEATDSDDPIQVVVLQRLHDAWPKRLHFTELLEIAENTKQSTYTETETILLAELLQTLYLQEIVQAHCYAPSIANSHSEYPKLNSVARYQASYQEVISTQLHDMVVVRDEWVRAMVQQMNGSNTLPQIAQFLYSEMLNERLPLLEATDDKDVPITDPESIKTILINRMTEIMNSFLENGVLMD